MKNKLELLDKILESETPDSLWEELSKYRACGPTVDEYFSSLCAYDFAKLTLSFDLLSYPFVEKDKTTYTGGTSFSTKIYFDTVGIVSPVYDLAA